MSSDKSTTRKGNPQSDGFTDEERAAMKERAKELKAEARANKKKEEGENDVLAKIAEMPESDRVMAERIHAIVTANGPTPAPRFDEFPADAPLKMMLHTMPFNVTGNPTLAIPTGFSRGGLPLGMQIVGRAFDEPTVFRIGAAYEGAAGWINKRPSLELPIAV